MVINMTLGFASLGRVTPGAFCCLACAGLAAAVSANAKYPADRVTATANGRVDQKVEKRRNMRLVRRRLLLGSPRLLVCFRRETLGGQRLS